MVGYFAEEAARASLASSANKMYLYNLTLQRATGITHSVHGQFSGAKLQEIVVSRGKILEMLRPDPNTGKVHTLLTTEIFGVVRSLMSFRYLPQIAAKCICLRFFNVFVSNCNFSG